MRRVILAALMVCVGAAAAAAADPRVVALGRQIAEGAGLAAGHACARCHGLLGTGKPR